MLFCRSSNTRNRHGRIENKPHIVQDYNKYMGGVDLCDMLLKKYSPGIRARKMWKKLLMNFLLRITGKYFMNSGVQLDNPVLMCQSICNVMTTTFFIQ